MFVANSEGRVAVTPPNPSCCTDPTVMCPRCAAAALSDAGYGPVGLTDNERPEPLEIPVINWEQEFAERMQKETGDKKPKRKERLTNNDGRPEPLVIPELTW